MDSITRNFKKHYRSTFITHGPTAKGADWKNQTDADLRCRFMLEILDDHSSNKIPSILDVGCGFGSLLKIAKHQKISLDYTGLDIVPEMITAAKKIHPSAKFFNNDIFALSDRHRFDYVVANGLLTQKLQASNAAMEKFMFRLINKMWSLAKIGIAFNVLTSRVDFKSPENFYYDPAFLLKKTEKLTRFFKIRHDSSFFEYTVFLYKKSPFKS
ncbi:MAG: class I SAM-dependent methyltransferase [Candidatus Pacebacteria bacterium]|nr:class I SAM-dependent methyltransferase [Candidatus Paceibacterota bacterium]